MAPDTMLEAGWPAHMTTHARAIEQARSLAHLEEGWYYSPRYGSCGGPVCEDAIADTVDLIASCAAQGLPAPWPVPIPSDTPRGIDLDWDNASGLCALEWARPGVWTAYIDHVPGSPEMITTEALDAVHRELEGA